MENNVDFGASFDQALSKIAKEDLIGTIEKLCEIHVKPGFGPTSLIGFITGLNQLLGDATGPIITFLQQANLNITVRATDKTIFTRLMRLKIVYGQLLMESQISLARPFGFQGLASGGEQGKENFYYHFRRRDGENFVVECVINETMQMSIQLLTGLRDKLKSGNNNIDKNLIREFFKINDELTGLFQELEDTSSKEGK